MLRIPIVITPLELLLDLFSFSPKRHNDKYVLLRRRIFKKRSNPTKFFEEIFDDFYFEGDDEYNGIKHSLPYKNIGPYIYVPNTEICLTLHKYLQHIYHRLTTRMRPSRKF